jgi:excisionase family DNA binding protein
MQPEAPIEPLAVSVKKARALIDVGHTKLWELIKDGHLKTIRIGRKRLVIYESLKKLVTP